MLQDIPEKEMKGHDILAVERFQDSTRHMVEFLVRKEGYACGEPGMQCRQLKPKLHFLTLQKIIQKI